MGRHAWVSMAIMAGVCAGPAAAQEKAPAPLDAALKNPWPAEWEKEFQKRSDAVLKDQCANEKAAGLGGRTYFENEKRAYGILMAHLLAGDRATAIKELQKEDAQADAWHRHTKGIDYYACFTLKHQVRKYFLFGALLAPEYRQRMFDGAKAWTEKDPLRRPHYAFVKPGEGWGPDVRNSWVDVRNTENLFLMRVAAVYLFAEETGNEATRQQYKDVILGYARALYRVGMGEWDSENYHGHSLSPMLNVYDFAKDPEVRKAAKAALDYFCTVGAVKYHRGAFNGPSNRDYNHPQPFGGSAPCMLWLYFGDAPRANRRFESDEVHVFSSSYRPPAAAVHLARKNFARPAELFAVKPNYNASTGGDLKSPPEYFETQYVGRTFQMGSLANGTSIGRSAINGFKITVADAENGALALQGVPGPDPRFVGSPLYQDGKVTGPNRIAQNKNVAVWLVAGGDSPWVWTLPAAIAVEQEKGVTFLRAEKTWVALHPLNLGALAVDDDLTKQLTDPAKKEQAWAGHRVVAARGKGSKYCGLAVEVGEAPDHPDYAAFKQAVLAKAKADPSGLADGVAEYVGASGRSVKLAFGATVAETRVWRDGKAHDWHEHAKSLFRNAGAGDGVLQQDWLGGKVTLRAGGSTFIGEVNDKGVAASRNE